MIHNEKCHNSLPTTYRVLQPTREIPPNQFLRQTCLITPKKSVQETSRTTPKLPSPRKHQPNNLPKSRTKKVKRKLEGKKSFPHLPAEIAKGNTPYFRSHLRI